MNGDDGDDEMTGLICTRCHEDSGVFPDCSSMSVRAAAALASGWLCAECLDELEGVEELP